MKKNVQFLLVFAAMLFCCDQVFGNGSSYSQGQAYLKEGAPTAGGKVYVSTDSTENEKSYKECTSSPVSTAKVKGASLKTKYYFYAKPNDGYIFTGWYSKNASTNVYTKLTSTQTGTTFCHSAEVTSPGAPQSTSDVYAYLDRYAGFVKDVKYTFIQPQSGSYTIKNDGVTVSGYPENMQVNGVVELTANKASGDRVKGWYSTSDGGITKQFFSFADKCELNFEENTTIGLEFCKDDGKALFWYEGSSIIYDNLNDAINSVQKDVQTKIIVVKGGNVSPRKDAQNNVIPYVIPSYVTLLVPFDNAYTCYTTQPGIVQGNNSTKTVFCKLTLLDETKIELEGAISVSATHASGSGGQSNSSSVYGDYGLIDMQGRSSIIVKNGGKLYVWGYIIDSSFKNQIADVKKANEYKSSIIVEDGGKVYEEFEMTDHHGGSSMSATVNSAFIFNQYYVQSIEVPLTILPGAVDNSFLTFYVEGERNSAIEFIGDNGLFSMFGEGSKIIKQYNPITDRAIYDVYGEVQMGYMTVNMKGMSVDTKQYIIPLTNNMSIIIHEGSTTSVLYDVSILPEAEIVIEKDATLKIGNTVYVYDSLEWCFNDGNTVSFAQFGFVSPLNYTGSNTTNNPNIRQDKKSKADKVYDAKILVNGTLQVDGYLMSTATGGNICSEQEGAQIILAHSGVNLEKGSGSDKALQQVNGTEKGTKSISTIPAMLKNGDGTYMQTALAIGEVPYPKKYTYTDGNWGMEFIKKEVDPETEEDDKEVSGPVKELVVTGDNNGNEVTATVTGDVISETITVNTGGTLEVESDNTVTTTNLIIAAEESFDQENNEGGKSGEVNVESKDLFTVTNVFFDLTLTNVTDKAIAETWHAFCVPFPVDLNSGITCYDASGDVLGNNPGQNEVDYAIMQYQGDVRAQGKSGWIKVQKTGAKVLTPGKFYIITVNDGTASIRFQKIASESLFATNSVGISPYGNDPSIGDAGWNAIGNPNLFKGSPAVENAYVLNPSTYTYETYTSSNIGDLRLAVGTPYFVKNTTGTQSMAVITKSSSAPARLLAAQTKGQSIPEQEVFIRHDKTYHDKLYVSASEDAEGTIADRGNLVKMQMTSTPSVPQLYAAAYDTKLVAMQAVLTYGDAEIALGIYAPKADIYTIYTNPSDEVTIYLVKDGEILTNLTESDYELSLEQGTTNAYSLRLVRKITDINTSAQEVSAKAVKAEKIILNGALYIFRDGKMYNAQGTAL